MGLAFTFIVFPVLILLTLGLLVFFKVTRRTVALKMLGAVWMLTLLAGIVSMMAAYFRKPIRLNRNDIIGEYRIDTSFFRGADAIWQYNHFRFTITAADSILFFVTNKEKVVHLFQDKILYSDGPPDLWKLQHGSSYHVLKYPPTLYRAHDRFYYVLKSDRYGNLFFRKTDQL